MPLTVLFAASDANWAAYNPALTTAFAEAGLDATLAALKAADFLQIVAAAQ